MKIKTEILKNMVVKAIRGASNNNLIPITSLMGIEVKEGKLTILTTDGSNHLRIVKVLTEENTGVDTLQDFYVVVNADTFSKLIAKTTSEYIEMNITNNYLEIKGNGNYKLEISIDEEGKIISFPGIFSQGEATKSSYVSIVDLKEALEVSRVSVAKTMEAPFLTGYYIGNKVMTTDREMMCCINKDLVQDPILVSSQMAELLQLLEGEVVELNIIGNVLKFVTDEVVIFGKQLEGIDSYPVTVVENLTSVNYGNTFMVKKNNLLDVLDRMSLFVSTYDRNGVLMSFTNQGLQITSQKSNASEILMNESLDDSDVKEFSCLIDVEMLKSQVQTVLSDMIYIKYGDEKAIQIVNDNTIIMISLLELEKGE